MAAKWVALRTFTRRAADRFAEATCRGLGQGLHWGGPFGWQLSSLPVHQNLGYSHKIDLASPHAF